MAEVSIEGKAQDASVKAALQTSWPPSDDDLTRVAQAAGAAAAAGACSYVGAAPAAPLCAAIGGKVAAFVADKLVGGLKRIFGRRNRQAAREYAEQKAATEAFFQYQSAAYDLAGYTGDVLTQIVESLEALHEDLMGEPGGGREEWLAALAFVGAPLVRSEAYADRPWVMRTNPVAWWNNLGVHTSAQGTGTEAFTAENASAWWRILVQIVDEEVETTGKAATVLAAKVAADAAAREAEQAARTFQFSATGLRAGQLPERRSFVPVVVGLGVVSAVGVGAWWAHRKGWFAA